MEIKYYPYRISIKIHSFIQLYICYKLHLLIGYTGYMRFVLSVAAVITSIIGIFIAFTCKMYIDEEGIKREMLFFNKKVLHWEEIRKVVTLREIPWVFGMIELPWMLGIQVKKFEGELIGFSNTFKDYPEFLQRVVTICEEQYPHIDIEDEVYDELEKLEEKEERKQLRRERIKKFFTRSED